MELPNWVPINVGLISNPLNWVIVILMVTIGTIAFSLVVGGAAKKEG